MPRLLAAFALVLIGTSPASAQFLYGPGFGGGFAYRSHFGFSAAGPGFHFSTYYRGFYAAPILPYYYYWTPTTIGGWGPTGGNPFFLPPPGFDPGGVAPIANFVPANPNAAANRRPEDYLPPGAKPNEYLVITPRSAANRPAPGPGTIAPVVDRVAPPPERPQPPAFRFDPFAERKVLGKSDTPDVDPVAEAARQVKLAREAFARAEYGDAVEALDRALRAKPDATALFLKGQAQFAAGQYAEAVASIQSGLKLAPEWPSGTFNPKELYGLKPAQFDRQVAELRNALASQPNEPSLQFLLAYQVWFSGDRPEATNLFRLLAKRLKDTSAVEPFLNAN